MSSANPYFDDTRIKAEVIDPPQDDDMMDISESVNDPARSGGKPNVAVSSSVRELLECPVCLNSMYPPIHQVCSHSFFISFECNCLLLGEGLGEVGGVLRSTDTLVWLACSCPTLGKNWII